MPKVEFIGANHLTEYHGVVSFAQGDIKDVTLEQAVHLVYGLPLGVFKAIDAVEKLDANVAKDTKSVEIEFLNNKYMDAYTGHNISFAEPGQRQMVSLEVAEALLKDHPDKFRISQDFIESVEKEVSDVQAEVEVLPEVTQVEASDEKILTIDLPEDKPVEKEVIDVNDDDVMRNAIINQLGRHESLSMGEISENIGASSWHVVRPHVEALTVNEILKKIDVDGKNKYALNESLSEDESDTSKE